MGARSRIRLLQGLVLATGAPVGWLALRLSDQANLVHEIGDHWELYLYLLIPTMVAFGTFGAAIGVHEDRLQDASRLFEQQALTDPLTGLRNRRYLVARLDEAVAESARADAVISLVILDLDHFKKVNDSFGHAVGDLVLRRVGQAFESTVRAGETSARTGGEEFALILPGAEPQEAADAAERVRARIAEIRFPAGAGPPRVRASAGIATVHGRQATPGRLLQAADEALYKAKRLGRDRVVAVDLRGSGGSPP